MKLRIMLLGMALCLVNMLAAQVKVGVQAGANLSTFAGKGSFYADKGNSQVGYQLGVTADYELGKHWMLMSGLSWVRRDGDLKLGMPYYGDHSFMRFPQAETAVNYLQVPLKLGYQLRFHDRFSLIPSVGLYAAYGFGAGKCALDVQSDEGKTTAMDWKPLSGKSEYGLHALRRWDWGGVAALKGVVAQHYTLELSYNLGIMKAQTQYGLRNSTWQLSVGYRF